MRRGTPASRLALVQRVICEGRSQAETAEGFGVSIRTVAKWVRRFRRKGVAGLEDGSSRPGVPAHQTPPLPSTAIPSRTVYLPVVRR